MGIDKTPDLDWANLLFGELVIRTLSALGIEHFVISPGSRSSPLTMAFEQLDPGFYSVVLDERSAAFHALGRIKATGKPAALICTSGSAGAHYYPAVIEASESGLPLIVLTADRPPELRHCHAGQTIDQSRLFGKFTVFETELPIPANSEVLLRQVREILRAAVECAQAVPGGPVHLNCPFREPFFPKSGEKPAFNARLTERLSPVAKAIADTGIQPQLPGRTLILAGPRSCTETIEEIDAVQELASRHNWPILADAANPLRHFAGEGNAVVVHYDRIVRDKSLWNRLQPQAVILWGEPPTSKVLREQLMKLDVPGYLVNQGKRAINPFHGRIQWACSSMYGFLQSCKGEPGEYAKQWMEADTEMESRLSRRLEDSHALFEGHIHRALARILPSSAPIILASSMAIRDADWFMPANNKRYRPYCQRGANGIDGTVSLARGIAAGLKEPAWLVSGDLAFLHDANGLLNSSRDAFGLFIVLVNNHGGGIFELLPVAKQCAQFEQLYATPQDVDISRRVAAHGAKHQVCESVESLERAIKAWDGMGICVAEIRIDRKASKDLHRRCLVMND